MHLGTVAKGCSQWRVGSVWLAAALLLGCGAVAQTVRVDTTPAHAIKFDPDLALGSSMDILPKDQVDVVYSDPLLKEALSAGWGPITYRQNTELTVAAWHWNPNGTWSDAAHQNGYFTGSAEPKETIRNSFGYPLAHRGNTRGDGSANTYSRLTDLDESSYWKSNPYLTKKFTGEDDALHPQWVVIEFDAPQEISAIRVAWANPYALKYTVQYWVGEDAFDRQDALNKQTTGVWRAFPSGEVQDGQGGTRMLKLATLPVRTRFLRMWMTQSSNTCDSHGRDDPRNCVGYAVNEIYAGNFTAAGEFIDLVTHAKGQNQTATFVSSMDPWHAAADIDIAVWPDAQGRTSWMGRFIGYLKEHGRLNDLTFVSFEHYPFAPCAVSWSDLYREPDLVRHILQVWRDDGVPENVPLMITESNLSWALTQPMADVFAALWLADNAGSFLVNGGAAFYHSPIQPEPLRPGCHGWSTYGNFVANEKLEILQHTSQYFASRMINIEWVKHGTGVHQLSPAAADLRDDAGHVLITAYAAKRPDGEWSLMLINKDRSNAHSVKIEFTEDGGASRHFLGPVTMVTFGAEQYVWHPEGATSHADPDGPPANSTLSVKSGEGFKLPKASVTVLRGKLDRN